MQIKNIAIEPPFILAPIAGVTTRVFRRICHELGSGAEVTEMISSAGLVYKDRHTFQYLKKYTGESPFWVQLFGANPELMARGAEIAVAEGAEIIDINMGCPVKKVIATGAGSALMKTPELAVKIVTEVIKAARIPVTVKMRSGWDSKSENYLEFARMLESAGVSAICLHPRTRAQGYSGKANHEHTKRLVEALKIPVMASGDIFSAVDAVKVKEFTGVMAVMVARGALGNPWIFREITGEATKPANEERMKVFKHHLDLHIEEFRGNENAALRAFRQHLIWYSKGIKGAPDLRKNIATLKSKDDMLKAFQDLLVTAGTY